MGLPEPAPLPPPEMPSTKLTDASRINKYIDAVQSQAEAFNPQAAGCIGACKPAVTAVIRGVQFVWPWYMWAYSWIYYYVSMAPRTVVQMIFGIALCFFGGTYVASIAAIEAFRRRDMLRGRVVRIRTSAGPVEGIVESIDPLVSITVRTVSGVHQVDASTARIESFT